MTVLNVGTGQQYQHIEDAIQAAKAGDTINVQAGTYNDEYFTVDKPLTLQASGGMVHLTNDQNIPNDKAIAIVQADVTIRGFEFDGAKVSEGNGAGIRYEGGNMVVDHCYFLNNQDGILGGAIPGGTVTVTNSEFSHNGIGDGYTHALYIGDIASLTVTGNYFHDTPIGHYIKSRAEATDIENNVIVDGKTGSSSYNIDMPDGGKGVVRNNVIEQGPNTDNPMIIHYGGEGGPYPGSSLLVSGNTIINDDGSSSDAAVGNATSITAQITGNKFYGLTSSQIASGPATQSGNTILSSEPSYSTASPWANDTSGATAGTGSTTGTGSTGTTGATGSTGGSTSGEQTSTGSHSSFAFETDLHLTASPRPTHIFKAGSSGATTNGTPGADALYDHGHAATLIGGDGGDTYVVHNAGTHVVEAVNGGIDTVKTNLAAYTLPANVENLTLTGTGAHTATGNGLDNIIRASAANDTLDGAGGSDLLIGGAGHDTFVMNHGYGNTVIRHFHAGDVVKLDGYAFSSFSDVQHAMTQIGSDVGLNLGDGHGLVFKGMTVAAFTASEFAFSGVSAATGSAPTSSPPVPTPAPAPTASTSTADLTGTTGHNVFSITNGVHSVAGLGGHDVAVLPGYENWYSINTSSSGATTVADNHSILGQISMTGVDQIQTWDGIWDIGKPGAPTLVSSDPPVQWTGSYMQGQAGGGDSFVFAQGGTSHDLVNAFDPTQDHLVVMQTAASHLTASDLMSHMTTDAAGDAVIHLSASHDITLQGIAPDHVHADWFLIHH